MNKGNLDLSYLIFIIINSQYVTHHRTMNYRLSLRWHWCNWNIEQCRLTSSCWNLTLKWMDVSTVVTGPFIRQSGRQGVLFNLDTQRRLVSRCPPTRVIVEHVGPRLSARCRPVRIEPEPEWRRRTRQRGRRATICRVQWDTGYIQTRNHNNNYTCATISITIKLTHVLTSTCFKKTLTFNS